VGEGLEEEEASSQYSGGAVTLQHRHKYMGDLSPVQESPEYKPPEEMNYQELEKDLNLALSKLNSEISQLPSDLTEETQITHTVTTTTNTQKKRRQQPSEEEDDSLFQGDTATHVFDTRSRFLTLFKILKPNYSMIAFKL
jgi:hypothetical protein